MKTLIKKQPTQKAPFGLRSSQARQEEVKDLAIRYRYEVLSKGTSILICRNEKIKFKYNSVSNLFTFYESNSCKKLSNRGYIGYIRICLFNENKR